MAVRAALHAYIETLVGGAFFVQSTNVVVGTSSKQLMPNNYERMAAAIVNTGTANLFAMPGATPTATQGVQLAANGGSMTLTAQEDLALVGYDWNGISVGAGTTVTVLEVIRYNTNSAAAPANPNTII